MASGQKRPRSGSLLGELLSSSAKLQREREAAPPIAIDDMSERQVMRPPPARQGGQGGPAREVCKECGRSEFDLDMSRGDKICTYCGAVQNSFPLTSYEEEHRSFADDEKGHLKKRVERANRDGKSGGTGVAASLQRAARLADSGEKSEMPACWASRQDKYVGAVRSLASSIPSNVPGVVIESAVHSARQLVQAMMDHDKHCPIPKCRLSTKPKHASIVGAAMLRLAALNYKCAYQLQDMVFYLKAEGVTTTREQASRRAARSDPGVT